RLEGAVAADRRMDDGEAMKRQTKRTARPRTEDRRPKKAVKFDPLDLAVMSHAVSMIAEEMGTVLERGSLSPNIRERRDASSALFDAGGRMVAQAAHIPVHLGAMP